MELSQNKNPKYKNEWPNLTLLPLYEWHLDLSLLNHVCQDLTVQILAKLLKQESFDFCFSLEPFRQDSSEKQLQLNHIQTFLVEFSNKGGPISLGYPFLLLEDVTLGRNIASPIFNWNLEFKNTDDNPFHWILSYESQNSLNYNEILKNYLIVRYTLDWEEIMIPVSKLKGNNLIKVLDNLASALDIEKPESPRLLVCPGSENSQIPKNKFVWSAVVFNPKIENNIELLSITRPKSRRSWYTAVSCLALDSSQESAVNDIFDGNDIIIKGNENSGKTRIIGSFIPSLITDGGSCLYISSKSSSILHIGAVLDKMELKDSSVWIVENENSAVENLLYQISKLPKNSKRIPKFNDEKYNLFLQQFLQLRKKLSERFEAINKPLLDGTDWTNMVGRFLGYHKTDSKQYLSRILDTGDYLWKPDEYYSTLKSISENEELFKDVKTLQHPLTLIQDYLFINLSKEKATSIIREQVRLYTGLLKELYHDYTCYIDAYADDLRFHYEGHVKALKDIIENIRHDLNVYQNVYGNSFDFSDGFTNTKLRVLSVFSKRAHHILSAKDKIYKSYDELKNLYKSKSYFEFNLPLIKQYLNLTDIIKDLNSFEKALDFWMTRIPKIVNQKINELTLKLPLKQEFKQKFEILERKVNDFFENLQKSNILKISEKPKSNKAVDRESNLRALLEKMTEIESSLSNLEKFYDWRNHWFGLPESNRKLITALVTVKPKNWASAFNSWYLYHFLDKNYSIHLPENDFPLQAYMELKTELSSSVTTHALISLREHQAERLKELKREQNFQASKISSKFSDVKLKTLIDELGLELISEFFPVICISAEMADKVFSHEQALFDIVILDDAHLIDIELGRKLSKLGAQKVVLGREGEEVSYLRSFKVDSFMKIHQLQNVYSKESKLLKKNIKIQKSFSVLELVEQIYSYLSVYISPENMKLSVEIDDQIILDLVISSEFEDTPKIALLVDGFLKQQNKFDVEAALLKSNKIKEAGYIIYHVWSIHWWRNPESASEELVKFVLNPLKK